MGQTQNCLSEHVQEDDESVIAEIPAGQVLPAPSSHPLADNVCWGQLQTFDAPTVGVRFTPVTGHRPPDQAGPFRANRHQRLSTQEVLNDTIPVVSVVSQVQH
jgi:hypothetical protein